MKRSSLANTLEIDSLVASGPSWKWPQLKVSERENLMGSQCLAVHI